MDEAEFDAVMDAHLETRDLAAWEDIGRADGDAFRTHLFPRWASREERWAWMRGYAQGKRSITIRTRHGGQKLLHHDGSTRRLR